MSGAPMPSSFDGDKDFYEENRWQKFSRLLKEEPLVPLGCGLTCYALFQATKSIRAGDHVKTNRMFRARIYAQGFTLLAIVVGSMYYQTDRQKRKEFEGVVAERKAKEKNEAWIRELEARDREDKDWRARRQAIKQAAKSPDAVGAAKSVVEQSERRGEGGILDAVRDLVQGRR
ncbi:MAG: hypothetical protein FRX48_05573 [Lasallia pustulata]|uniref:HIG1 domain-containing protein n=1 Tax=Lasallia pustulata TaxID=136370 RepID=A0A5M8PNT5_9LECA|nr:MAG: hypothetical protein FRX48_05573 [Lasallia pustulata]